MAIPGPGVAISMDTLNTEFGGGYSLSSYYRGGSFVPNTPQNLAIPTSGAISLGNFYGATKRIAISLTAASNNYDVYGSRGPTYSPGISDITVTVPGTVGSAGTGSYAMLVPNAFSPTDTVTIINNGVIQGAAGPGAAGAPSATPATPASGGGNALYINRPTTITNNGTIAGGGGGGGGGGGAFAPGKLGSSGAGGGGGGGGAGQAAGSGGAGGVGTATVNAPGSPGSPGNTSAGGGGGAGGVRPNAIGGAGGAGGGRGAAGSAGLAAPLGPTKRAASNGGGAGNYIVGNAFVTWPATGTRQGGVA